MTKRKPGRPRKAESDLYVRVSITLPRPEAEWLRSNGASRTVLDLIAREFERKEALNKMFQAIDEEGAYL